LIVGDIKALLRRQRPERRGIHSSGAKDIAAEPKTLRLEVRDATVARDEPLPGIEGDSGLDETEHEPFGK
jgi:hypothetical protein